MSEEILKHVKPACVIVHGPVDMIGVGIGAFTGGWSHVVQYIEDGVCFHFTFPRAHFFTLPDLLIALRIPTHGDLYAYPKMAVVEHPEPLEDIQLLWDQCNLWRGTEYDTKELFTNHLARRLGLQTPPVEDKSDVLRWVCSSGIAHMRAEIASPWPVYSDFGYGPDDFIENGRLIWTSAEC